MSEQKSAELLVYSMDLQLEVFGQPGGGAFRGVKKYGDSPGFWLPSGTVIDQVASAPQRQSHLASYVSSNVTVNRLMQGHEMRTRSGVWSGQK
jgi:hypothetical protein